MACRKNARNANYKKPQSQALKQLVLIFLCFLTIEKEQ